MSGPEDDPRDDISEEEYYRGMVEQDRPADDEPDADDDEADTEPEPTPIEPPAAVHLMDEYTTLFLDEGHSSGG